MVPENLKKQLALAVRSIQWSYAIYWTGSPDNPGAFEWGEGYYNGDIKTRKTSQAVELNSDQIGLRRSEQLRDLYESLATAESSPQAKRPSAALSPEDLTDTEWYYLVCMSFVFNISQGLPGRTLAKGQPIWLYSAHLADSRIFSRSLLAKSASIQTVVCFPFLDGVLELGTIDLVSEDLSLIQRMRTSYLDILDAKVRKNSVVAFDAGDGEEIAGAVFDHNAESEYEVANAISPNNSSNELQANKQADERFMAERINDVATSHHVQNWQVMEDELGNCAHTSMNTSDCISQTFAGSEKNNASLPKGDHRGQDLQDGKNTKTTVVDVHSDDWHYQSVLSSLLKSSDQLIMGAHFQNFHCESGFVGWKREGPTGGCQRPRGGTHQKLLKKILFEVPRMHMDWLLECQEENDYKEGMRPAAADEIGLNHVLSERKRRAKLNERFLTLKSMFPLITRDDKVSILDEAIAYLKKLEKKVRDLEARRESKDSETRTKRAPQDVVERTCDNYCNNRSDNGKKPAMNKRKACDIDETETEIDSVRLKDISNNVTICMNDNEVLIELKCPWREGVLLEIMEAVSNLHLDFHAVHSSEADGTLYLTMKSKIRGAAFTSTKKIKQALVKAAWKCWSHKLMEILQEIF